MMVKAKMYGNRDCVFSPEGVVCIYDDGVLFLDGLFIKFAETIPPQYQQIEEQLQRSGLLLKPPKPKVAKPAARTRRTNKN